MQVGVFSIFLNMFARVQVATELICEAGSHQVDGIREFQHEQYLSASEAVWKLFCFEIGD